MRFSPNPNNLRPRYYESNVLLDEYVNMYEYVNPNLPQRPYLIVSNYIGIELEYVECILQHILPNSPGIHYTIEHDICDDIMHIVVHGIYFKNGYIAQQFHDHFMSFIPDKIAMSFLEIRHNARLNTRYIKLISVRTCITNINKIEDLEYMLDNIDNVTWYKTLLQYLWSIPSYLTLLSNNQYNA